MLQLSEVWNRYCELALKADVDAPLSYKGRRATFKEKFQIFAQDFYVFITVPNKDVLLVHRKFVHVPISGVLSEGGHYFGSTFPTYQSTDGLLELIHVALQFRDDILLHLTYSGCVDSEDEMIACVPECLCMYICLMFGDIMSACWKEIQKVMKSQWPRRKLTLKEEF